MPPAQGGRVSGEHRDRVGGRVRERGERRGRRRAPRHQAASRTAAPRRVDESDAYRGRRRWPEPTRRRLLAVGTVLVLSLLAAAGLGFGWPEVLPDVPGLAGERPAQGQAGPPEAGPEAAAMSPEPQPQPEAQNRTENRTEAGTRGSTVPSGSPTRPKAQAPIRIEAEDSRNSVIGAAQRVSYGTASGGVLVRGLGNPPGGGTGTLTVPVTVADAGPYNLVVRTAIPEGPAKLTLVVTVSGSIPVAIPVTGRSLCCGDSSGTVALQAGTNWISFGNPSDRGPAVDFIQLTQAGK
jgi:hypothetical protein